MDEDRDRQSQRVTRAQRESMWVATGLVVLLGVACPLHWLSAYLDILSPASPPPMGFELVFMLAVGLPVVATLAFMNFYATRARFGLPRWARGLCWIVGAFDLGLLTYVLL